jgi:hypothetical protein
VRRQGVTTTALYWKQFGGGPDEALRKQMDPDFANR